MGILKKLKETNMKAIIVIIISISFFSDSFGQKLSSTEKVDSFFNANLNLLKIYTENKETILSSENLTFINLITQMSGISPTIQYGIAVNSKQYKAWKKWFKYNKHKINWEFHIVEGEKLIKQGMPIEEKDQEKYINSLKSLKIQ
jgi:hypothetical protein